jgi:hypothetical protein
MSDDPDHRMSIAGHLGQHLGEQLWSYLNLHGTIRLGGDEYDGPDDVPFYEDAPDALLLRRVSDGKVFEIFLEPEVRPAWDLRQLIRYHRRYHIYFCHDRHTAAGSIRDCPLSSCRKAVTLVTETRKDKDRN